MPTSAKGEERDPVTGEPVELLWVKGSGGDLGTLTEAGLAVSVISLWLLQESLRGWRAAGRCNDGPGLLAAAAQLPVGGSVVDVDDTRLLSPGDMPGRFAALADERCVQPPRDEVAVVRCIIDSLAPALARAVHDAALPSGQRVEVEVVQVLGGGSQNALLCQLIADACALPVVAGPVEATVLGNILVPARACGTLTGDVDVLCDLVGRTQPPRRFEPVLRGA